MNAFEKVRDAILLKRFGMSDQEDELSIPMAGDDVTYGEDKETKEAKAEREGE